MTFVLPTVTGYSSFWLYSNPSGYAPKFYRSSHERRAAMAISGHGFRKQRAQILALMGAAAGGAATDTNPKVQAVQAMYDAQSGGGRRTIQTVNNGSTTTGAMETAIEARMINQLFAKAPSTYPVDLAGNGGGNRVGR